MVKKDIVVVGGSTGGLDAFRTVAAALPMGLEASIFVALHSAPEAPGLLAAIFDRSGPLPAAYAVDGERIEKGRIYVAPRDRHLMLEPGRVCLSRGPKENRFRPAVDPLFRSAASVYGPRVVGVVLSGGLDDGAAGLWAVERLGGTTVVQDPADALEPSMPESAAAATQVDYVVPAAEIGPLLARIVVTDADEMGEYPVPKDIDIEVRIAKEDKPLEVGVRELGEPSIYACPECHGVLLQLVEGERIRFRCHTGHAYSLESLLSEIEEKVEDSLWISIRALQEGGMLLRHLAGHLGAADSAVARQLLERAAASEQRSDLVRQAVLNGRQGRSGEADD
jgi:two-component system chemotaxis response regulator CheB